TIHTVYLQLDSVRHLGTWFRKKGRRSVGALIADDLTVAHRCFSTQRRDPRYAWGLRGFIAYLQTHGFLKPGRPKPLSRSEREVTGFWSICARIAERPRAPAVRADALCSTF